MIDKDKVREICRLYWDAKEGTEDELITQLLEQNQPSPVVVGLSDEQLRSLHKARYRDYLSLTDFVNNYDQWAKTQTFTQPEVTKLEKELADVQIAYIDLQRYSSEIKKELEQLKSQQFKPDWKNVPKQAVEALMMVRFFDSAGMCCLNEDIILNRAERPKPTVEVGQVWRSDMEEVRVIEFGRRDNKQTVCFKDVNTDCIKQLTTSYFLEKFEMVR